MSVFDWFKDKRATHPEVGISGPVILSFRSEHLATLHVLTDFKPTNGWLDRWKKRYQLSFLTMSGSQKR